MKEIVDTRDIPIRDNKYVGKIQIPPDLIPTAEEEKTLEDLIKVLPYYLLKYGEKYINKFRDNVPLPPTLDIILKYGGKALSIVGKKIGVK